MQLLRTVELPRSLSQYVRFPASTTVAKNTYSRKTRANRLDLLLHLVWREFAVRYRRSAFGVLWSIVPTLIQLLTLVFLFKKVVPLGIDAYPAFVLSGLLPWAWFSNAVTSSSLLFSTHRDLVRRPNFPPSTLVIVNTLVELINYMVFLPVLLAMLLFYDRNLTSALLFAPVLLAIQALMIVGISLITASLNVMYGDVKHIANLAVMPLFYLTPIFYQVQTVGERYQSLFHWNPLAVLIEGYRDAFFYGRVPELGPLLIPATASVALWGIGQFIHRRQLSRLYDAL
jgi:lipopolysaccharide transport system permease protein